MFHEKTAVYNVLYNWGYNSCYGGEAKQNGAEDKFNFFTVNMVANYYKPGPATQRGKVSYRIANPGYRENTDDYGKWYVAENVVEGSPEVTADNWNGGVQPAGGDKDLAVVKLEKPWPAMPISQQSAQQAYVSVLENAGAMLPARDVIDARIIDEVRGGYSTFEGKAYKKSKKLTNAAKPCGIIDSQNDVGGWPNLKSTAALADTDHDGMPDSWETRNALDPKNPDDRNKKDDHGYTYLEKYLNSLCGE